MKLPDGVLQTRDRYVQAFPLWSMEAGAAADDRARKWTIGLASQIVHEHGETYGSKRADPTRPISKDAIAQQQGPYLYGWDMLTGAGSGTPKLVSDPSSIDITGQYFEHVEGRDVIAMGGSGGESGGGEEGGGDRGMIPVIPYNEAYSVQFGQGCNAVYAESGKPFDPGMVSVHSQRAGWDYYVGQMPWEQSYNKHINEFRKEYGLPPV